MKVFLALVLLATVLCSCAHVQHRREDRRAEFLSWGQPRYLLLGGWYRDGGSVELKLQYGNSQIVYVYLCKTMSSQQRGNLFVSFDQQRYTEGFLVARESPIYAKLAADAKTLYATVDNGLMSETKALDRKWTTRMGAHYDVSYYHCFSALKLFAEEASNKGINADQ